MISQILLYCVCQTFVDHLEMLIVRLQLRCLNCSGTLDSFMQFYKLVAVNSNNIS